MKVCAADEVEKVRLVGLGASVGLPETTSVTGIISGELVALGLVMLIVAE